LDRYDTVIDGRFLDTMIGEVVNMGSILVLVQTGIMVIIDIILIGGVTRIFFG